MQQAIQLLSYSVHNEDSNCVCSGLSRGGECFTYNVHRPVQVGLMLIQVYTRSMLTQQ